MGHVAHVRGKRNEYKSLVRKTEKLTTWRI